MAGDWIKIRTNLATDPAVKAIARALKLDPFSVVGRLHAFWAWADQHTNDGEIPWMTFEDIDDVADKRGFAAQLAAIGWLEQLENAVRLPHFERHNGDSAKRRAMEMDKKRRQREGDNTPPTGPAVVPMPSGQNADKTGTREEKRRGEETRATEVDLAPAAPDARAEAPPPARLKLLPSPADAPPPRARNVALADFDAAQVRSPHTTPPPPISRRASRSWAQWRAWPG